jgi:excisionase family DNA binding protein
MRDRSTSARRVPKRFYRVREICQMTGLSKGKVFQALKEGRLQGLKLEGVLLIPVDSFEGYLAEALPWSTAGTSGRVVEFEGSTKIVDGV